MTIFDVGVVGSTMEVAAEGVRAGSLGHLDAVLAHGQTAGRGRQGKAWRTFDGVSVAATVMLRGVKAEHLALLTSVTLRRALLEVTGKAVDIKWPNDLLLGGKKVAGILVDVMGGGEVALVGMGVNLRAPAEGVEDFAGGFLDTPVGAKAVLEHFLTCYAKDLALYETHGWAALHESYARACVTLGQTVRWRGAGETSRELVGLARGLTPDGALEVADATGAVHVLNGGLIVAQGLHHSLEDEAPENRSR